MLPCSLVSPFRVSSVTMVTNLITIFPMLSSSHMASSCRCHALTPHLKTLKLNALFVPSIMLFAPSYFRLVFHQPIGLRLFLPPPFFLTFFLPRHSTFPPTTWCSTGTRPPMFNSVSLGVVATPIFLPQLPTNSLLNPPCAPSLVTPLIIKTTAASTGHPTRSSSSSMWSLMRRLFHSPRTLVILPPRIEFLDSTDPVMALPPSFLYLQALPTIPHSHVRLLLQEVAPLGSLLLPWSLAYLPVVPFPTRRLL